MLIKATKTLELEGQQLILSNLSQRTDGAFADIVFDGYWDEGQVYAQKLKDIGIPTIAKVYPGTIHDFLLMTGKLDIAKTLVEDAVSALRTGFNTTG